MKFQHVLQLPVKSEEEFDRLLLVEEAIEGGSGDLGNVDGHDFGSGEMNIFIHTDDPIPAFEKAISLIGSSSSLDRLKAGYRDFEEDEYTPIYPKGLQHFSVI